MQHPRLVEIMGEIRSAERQDGLSNCVLRVEADRGSFYLRLGSGAPELAVDRAAEAANMQLAADLGLAVAAEYVVPETGLLLTRELGGLQTDRSLLPELLGAQLARLHGAGMAFQGQLDPAAVFDGLREQFARAAEEAVAGVRQDLEDLTALFGQHAERLPQRLVPSHGDLSPGNCLIADGRLSLIDWEYSAMADPAWDLAYAIQENKFMAQAETRFLTAYQDNGGQRPPPDHLRMMKARSDAISALWALVQGATGRDRETFLPFARARIDRALGRSGTGTD